MREGQYIKLQSEFTADLTWSNDPSDLDLYCAFGEDKPNLFSDFHLDDRLYPILKEKEGDMYILRDTKHVYYVWDPWYGPILKVSAEYSTVAGTEDEDFGEGLGEVEKIVSNILFNLHWVLEESEVICKKYH